MNDMNMNYKFQAQAEASQHDCQDALTRILPPGLGEMIRTRFATLWKRRPHLLHLAITEAAALADRTGFPSLFLPALALEKAEAAAAWHSQSQTTQRSPTSFGIHLTRFN